MGIPLDSLPTHFVLGSYLPRAILTQRLMLPPIALVLLTPLALMHSSVMGRCGRFLMTFRTTGRFARRIILTWRFGEFILCLTAHRRQLFTTRIPIRLF